MDLSPTLNDLLPHGRASVSIVERMIRLEQGDPVIDPEEARFDDLILDQIDSVLRGCKYKNGEDLFELQGISKLMLELRTKVGVEAAIKAVLIRLFSAETKSRYR